jgi:hypothetical protein
MSNEIGRSKNHSTLFISSENYAMLDTTFEI